MAIQSGTGHAYVTGQTFSTDFPTLKAIQNTPGGSHDAFITQIISASGVYTYGYSTYLGGGGGDDGNGIAVDSAGNAYVAGLTGSTNFPTLEAVQANYGGGVSDAFVTQIISASGIYTYGYSTYLGGSGDDYGYRLAVDSGGNVYFTGETHSADFPRLNALQDSLKGPADGFVAKINLHSLRWYFPIILKQ